MSSTRSRLFTWKRFVYGCIILFVVSGFLIVYKAIILWRSLPEAYAAWTTGNLMVEYLKTHTNEWPRGWDDLRSATNSLSQRGMPVYTPLDQLQTVVKIDWRIDPAELQQLADNNPTATVKVVTRPDGSRIRAQWGADTEPNAKIMRYLRSQSKR